MPRMYQPAWQDLKKSISSPKFIRIAAPAKLHPRIYKAIIKEKDMDVIYKLQLLDEEIPRRARLRRKSVGGMLTIFLDFSIGIDDFPDFPTLH